MGYCAFIYKIAIKTHEMRAYPRRKSQIQTSYIV